MSAAPRTDDELLALVPQALTSTEVERAFWLGVLKGSARADCYFDRRAEVLRDDAYDPDTCPDNVVPYLAAAVGLDPSFTPIASLTVVDLRRMIGVAVALWKRKGTTDSWRGVLNFLGPSRALLLDWFYLRSIEGTALSFLLIPDPADLGGNYNHPETVTDVWCVDPRGTLDFGKLARFLDEFRPLNERINLYPALFVEDCRVGLAQWTGSTPGRVRFDGERVGILAETAPGSGVPTVAIASPDQGPDLQGATSYHVFARLAVTGSTGGLWVGLQTGDSYGDGYEIRIGTDNLAGSIQVFRWVGGVASAVAGPDAAPPIVEGYRYRYSVEIGALTGGTEIQVRLEAVLVATVVDTDGGRYYSGRWGVGSGVDDGDAALLDSMLVFRSGVEPRRVGPS